MKKLKDFLLYKADVPMWGFLIIMLVMILDIIVIATKIL